MKADYRNRMKQYMKRGFSLIELIVVVAIMAIISAVIIPSISGTRDAALEQRAIAAAEALNMAQSRYRLEVGLTAWDAIAGDADRYKVLKPYLEYADDDLTKFKANRLGGVYSVSFSDSKDGVMQRVTLKKGATEITY